MSKRKKWLFFWFMCPLLGYTLSVIERYELWYSGDIPLLMLVSIPLVVHIIYIAIDLAKIDKE